MADKKVSAQTIVLTVSPGSPTIEAVKQIDVTGWEPAAIFVPVSNSAVDPTEGSE